MQVGDTVTLTVNGNSSYTGRCWRTSPSASTLRAAICGRHQRWTPASPPPTRRATPRRRPTTRLTRSTRWRLPPRSRSTRSPRQRRQLRRRWRHRCAVTGTVGGDVQVGDTVTLTVNGNSSTPAWCRLTSPSASTLPGSDLGGPTPTVHASVTTTDAAGNSTTATDTRLTRSTRWRLPPRSRSTPSPATTSSTRGGGERQVAITGTVGGDVQVGDTVTLTVNNNSSYTGLVQADFTFSIDVAGQRSLRPTPTWTPASPPPTRRATPRRRPTTRLTRSTRRRLPPRSRSTPSPRDNIVNIAEEAGGQVAVTGTVGGDVQVGDTVTLTVNGNSSYTGLVQADFTFSIDVAGSDLAADTNVHASVTTTDAAGNIRDRDRRPGLHGRHDGACRHDHARRDHGRQRRQRRGGGRRPVLRSPARWAATCRSATPSP